MIITNTGIFLDDGETPFAVATSDQTARDAAAAAQATADAAMALIQALGVSVSASGVLTLDNSNSSVQHTLLSGGRVLEIGADDDDNFIGRILKP